MNGQKSKKVGLFGGTFDPVHYGHIHLALALQSAHGLDEIWFMPTHLNPLKRSLSAPASAEQRLAMVKLATASYPAFKVEELELKRPPPSYTIDSVKILIEREPQVQFYLMLGADAVETLPHWHCIDELVNLVPLLIGSRLGEWPLDMDTSSSLYQAVIKGFTQIPLYDVSATELRFRFAQHLPCHHLIPPLVYDYIEQHGLYRVK